MKPELLSIFVNNLDDETEHIHSKFIVHTNMSGTDMNENSSVQDENKMYKDQNQIPQNSNAKGTCV